MVNNKILEEAKKRFPTDSAVQEVVNQVCEGFMSIYKQHRLDTKEQEREHERALERLEKCFDGIENKNKEYNKLKRFLVYLQEEEEEESDWQSDNDEYLLNSSRLVKNSKIGKDLDGLYFLDKVKRPAVKSKVPRLDLTGG